MVGTEDGAGLVGTEDSTGMVGTEDGTGLVGTEDDPSKEGSGFDLVRRVLDRPTFVVPPELVGSLLAYISHLLSGGSCLKCSNN